MASNPSSSAAGGGGDHGGARLEDLALDKVAEAADAVAAASSAGEVVRAIHAVAAIVFPVDSATVAGTVDEPFRSQIINGVSLSSDERGSWRHAFCHGPAFPTLSKILLGHVALKWLHQIRACARKEICDSFFVKGSPTEVIQALVPALSHKLLVATEQAAMELAADEDANGLDPSNSVFLFVGEVISRASRRGSTGILGAELIPRIRSHLKRCMESDHKTISPDKIKHVSQFWFNVVEAIRDQHSVERLAEEMLRQLASQHTSDEEAYWILWTLFNQSFMHKTVFEFIHIGSSVSGMLHLSVKEKVLLRAMFVDKFLRWKTFPLCCLRWILHYAVFELPPNSGIETQKQRTSSFLGTLQTLVSVWSKKEFVQAYSVEQQACIL
ncbi:hypothetical protein OsJ_07387 [Oryza sativa Japonica Group]|uniref:TELO2 ARM repeat domain-containing protein n=1 Tax=Oryza sativa subsp. japonica TaxID=39947 RepID=A3A8P6_ORYSJ|nr:hypothetical protein OsJ_07387 [Oryza sativa Japonica Group]